jgi:hypothetical protein
MIIIKKLFTLVFLCLFFAFPKLSFAIENPKNIPNNKLGVHILFVSELSDAARLVNTNGGDWGYVTIPIQARDRDLEKWQKFMDDAKKFHLIPIIRLATESYYFETSVWRKPTGEDVIDFANFLNSLNWPVKNRYVVVFNEVNRGDEWQGTPNPREYAKILDYSVEVFKARSDDFFIISAGLDNSAANVENSSMDQYDFMTQMAQESLGIFKKIDGLGSHSYPNPGFSQSPRTVTSKNITSFKFEKNLALELSGKDLPIFITETGWSKNKVPEDQIALYFNYAFGSVWNDESIIAVTPFLLHAGTEPFSQFSLMSENGGDNKILKALQEMPKNKGEHTLNPDYFLEDPDYIVTKEETFPQETQYSLPTNEETQVATRFLKWFFNLSR